MASFRELSFLHNLIAIAYVDGKICNHELEFLQRKAEQIGVDSSDLARMIENAHELEVLPPGKHSLKMKYLNECVEMAMADGKITAKELAKCKKICEMIGLDQVHLQEAITLKNALVL